VGRTAEEKEKVEVAVLQARVAHDAHPPRPPPPLAMEMLSEEEMATAIRRSEEDTVDTARHQRLVDKLEEEGKKRLDLALVDASQVAAASIGEGALDSVATPGGEAVAAAREGREENRQRSRKENVSGCSILGMSIVRPRMLLPP
jgi:hypothetical protein